MHFFLGLVLVLLVIDLLLRVIYVRLILRLFELKPPFSAPTLPPDPMAEKIQFPTRDGILLRGSLYRTTAENARGLILFCPEMEGNHWSAKIYCGGLIESGFNVLSFDFRGQGESDFQPPYSPTPWPTRYEGEDVRSAFDFIETRDDLRNLPLGVMGVSRGSTPALIGAAEFSNVGAVCCEGAYSTDSLMLHFMLRWATLYVPKWALNLVPKWHYQVTSVLVRWTSSIIRQRKYAVLERWLPKLKNCPVLLVAGERDSYVHPDVARGIHGRIKSPTANIWHVPRAKHNQARITAGAAEYDRRLTDFFSQITTPITAN